MTETIFSKWREGFLAHSLSPESETSPFVCLSKAKAQTSTTYKEYHYEK